MGSQSYILTLFDANIDQFWEKLHDDIYATGIIVYLGSQLERCPQTGSLHWQAYVKFARNQKQRGTWFKRFHNGIHFTKCNKERAEAIDYGTKNETRVAGPKEDGIKPTPAPKEDLNSVLPYIMANDKKGVMFKHVLRFQLERRWDAIRAFYFEETRRDLPRYLPNPWGRILDSKKDGKKRHYWIFSRQPDKGKTYWFARPLAETYKVEICTGDMTYFNFKGMEQCIIFDEFNTAKLKWDTLNSMCDGTHNFRKIYSGGIKLDNPLIIILSNQSISDLYPHMNQFLYARFIEYELL